MGDVSLEINYWVVCILLGCFLGILKLKRNPFNKINLVIYLFYTIIYIYMGIKESFSLFKLILLHFMVSMLHLLVSLFVNVIFK